MTEQDFKLRLKTYKETNFPQVYTHPIFPPPDKIYEKKALFKNYGHFMKVPMPESVTNNSVCNTATKSVSSSTASNQNKRGTRKK
jgi:hypothetical protein